MADLVVVGASLAGLRAVEAVRNDGFEGSITLVGAEEHLPYDRPPLSKEHLADDEPADPTLREREKLDDLGVELLLGEPATALDTDARTVTVGGRDLDYGALVVATGSTARALPETVCPPDLDGVVTLRSLDDSRRLRDLLRQGSPRVVVVGAGFIGSEIAAVARGLDLDVTIVEALDVPLVRGVGERMGRALTGIHERYGTRVLTGASVEEISGDGGVEQVVLGDGTTLDADVVVVGIGASPTTGWLESSGLTLDDGVVADATLAAAPGVYVAGDVARWPNGVFDDLTGGPMRLEHWTAANEQGARAARNAVDPGNATPYETVPYFWSDWYGGRIQFVGISAVGGDAPAVETEVVMGSEDGPFVALYRSGDRLIGAMSVNRPAEVMQYRRLLMKQAGWDDALAKAQERRERAERKAAEKKKDTEKQ